MAGLSSFIVLLLIAAAGQAVPIILAAPFSNDPNGLPNLPTMSGLSGPLTMTEPGGNVIACSSQVTFLLSSTIYLDCLEPVMTITVGTSSASALHLVQLTIAAGLTLKGLPLVYANRTETATLLPSSTGQVSSASSATQSGGSASSFGFPSSPSRSTQPRGNTTSSVLNSSASGSTHSGGSSPSSRQTLTSGPAQSGTRSTSSGLATSASGVPQFTSPVISSGRSSSTLQTGGTGPVSLSIVSSASSNLTQGTGAASAPSASWMSSVDSLSINRPTIQANPSGSSTGRSGLNASGNLPSLSSGPSNSQRLRISRSTIPPTTSTSNGSTLLPAPAPSTYTIDGVGFTGSPSSLVVGSTTLIPGGAPLIRSSHTFSIPVSATGGQIDVDGTLTTLPGPRTGSGSSIAASAPARSSISSQSNSTDQSIPGNSGITSTSLTTNAQGSRTPEVVAVGSTAQGASLPGAFTSAAPSNSQTPTVTSTETAIPPGASAETLTSGAFLVNQWITTTKPGSSAPTVIPIILPPGGGAPIALLGFLPGPPPDADLPSPPALELHIPKLKIPCVKFFGLKFGGCSSDDGSNTDNPTNDPTNTQPTHTELSNTQSAPSTTKSQSSPLSRSSSNSQFSRSSSQSRSSSSSGSQSCSRMTATVTHVSCATAGASTFCTTQFKTNVGCSASGSAITSGSCVAKTTVGSSTACCSSATVSSGSTVCAFADLTQWDLNSPPSDLQTAPPSAQLAFEFWAYLATRSGASGRVGNGTAASATGSVFSTSRASSTGPASVNATSSAVSPHNSASSAGLTRSGSSSVAPPAPANVASSSSAAANADPLCIANGKSGGDECVCSIGTIIVTISSYFNPSSNVCGYKTIPSIPVITTHTSSTPKPTRAIYSYTDPNYGYVVACDSTYTSVVAGHVITECTGSSSTISTDASVVSFDSAYLAAESSSSAASAASAASVSSAVATPTARILITSYTYEDNNVFSYQYRAYDGVPGMQIAYCSTAKPISFVNLDSGKGDPSDLPTNQLHNFTTHGIKDCTYYSPSRSEAGTVSCPGWASPVQCTSVVGSEAQEYQCPAAQGGTEQQPIINCDWGANP